MIICLNGAKICISHKTCKFLTHYVKARVSSSAEFVQIVESFLISVLRSVRIATRINENF